MGEVALTLVRELLLNVGKKLINKSGNKRQSLVLAFIILASTFAIAQYPTTGNNQRLGYQTTGDGLVFRGRSNDTTTIKSSGLNNAYHIYDTINNVLYSYVKTKGGWLFNNSGTVIINNNFTQPVDSLFFNVGVPTNNVDTAKMRWDSDLATVVLGLNDNVPNELGFKNFWLVKNQTGSTITKGSLVYANGAVGASGRITVAKFIANGSIDAKYLLGITAHDLTDGEDGYVISFGKIRQINTDTFAAGAILYPSPTVAGVWTDVEPVAPNIDMPIGFCINSSVNNGTIAIRVASGYKLNELHDLRISSPIEKASLYYTGGLWRDTTAALLVSDTASMLTNYLRTGVAANSYLPLTGGTLTGSLDINTNNGGNNFQDSTLKVTYNQSSLGVNQNVTGIYSHVNTSGYTSTGMLSEASTIYSTAIGIKGKATQSDVNGPGVAYGVIGEISASGSGSNGSTYAGYFNNTSIVGGNNYGLYVNTASGGDYGIYQTGSGNNYLGSNTSIGGTLDVTGATTLSNLAGTGSRMVVAGSGGLLSTQAIPTGTVTSVGGTGAISSSGGTTPVISVATAAFGTAGIVSSTGTQQFSGDKIFEGYAQFNGIAFFKNYTYQATRLAGLSSTDRFATVTLGSGLSLSGGILSATSGGVTSVTASTPLSSSGGTTPNITIADAGTGSSGVVNTTTQSFAGNKTFTGTLDVTSTGTFGGRVKTNWLERNYAYSTSSSFTVSVNTTWQDVNTSVLTTITLPNAATYPGKELHIRQTGAGQIISFSSNVIPFTSPPTSSAGTAILNTTNNKAVTLVSDGTNWIIMQRSGN